MELNYQSLKERQRRLREGFPKALALRTHRALSWLDRAEQEAVRGDQDARFVFLWIAFNAAYANEIGDRRDFSERRLLLNFLNRLIDSDRDKLMYELLWNRYSGALRLLIENHYVYPPFWDFVNGQITEADWKARFERSRSAAGRALANSDAKKVFAITFDRLYTLRNQIVHGGATWNSSVNRSQVKDGANILGDVVPVIIHLMMENPGQLWGEPCFPVVGIFEP